MRYLTQSLAAALMFVVTATLSAQDTLPPDTSAAVVPAARHSIHLELGSVLVNDDLSLNYEYRLTRNLSLRAGAVLGVQFEGGGAFGGILMASILPGGEKSVELGAGVSLMDWSPGSPSDRSGFHVQPAMNIGYRYQPDDGGFLFRTGMAYIVSPLPYVGFGYTF